MKVGRYAKILGMLLVVAVVASTLGVALTATAAENEEKIVKVAMGDEVGTLNPFTYQTIYDYMIIDLIYDSLVRIKPDLSPTPWLAERWEISSDGLVYTFYLVKNATWQDGTPLTAKDVAFTFNYILEHKFPRMGKIIDYVEKAEAVDDYTVKIYLKKPYAPFITEIATTKIVPEHIWKDIEDPINFRNENPVGSGPFKQVEWVADQYHLLKAYDNYWKGRPKIDGILFKIIKLNDVAFMALKKGEVDAMTWTVPYSSIEEAEKDPNIRIALVMDPNVRYLAFNLKIYPLNIKEFRHAVAYAINRQAIVDTVLLGYGVPGHPGVIPPVLQYWYNPNVPQYPYNPEKAKQILDSLGFIDRDGDGIRETPNGTKLEFDIIAMSTWTEMLRATEMIRDWLQQVGIKLNIVTMDFNTMVAKINNREFELHTLGFRGGSADPDFWLSDLFHSRADKPGGFNFAGYHNPEFDQLCDQQVQTPDPEKRRQIIFELQEILAEDLPWIPLFHQKFAFAYRVDRFTGWVPMNTSQGVVSIWSFLSLQPVGETTTTPAKGGISGTTIAAIVLVIAVIAIGAFILTRKK